MKNIKNNTSKIASVLLQDLQLLHTFDPKLKHPIYEIKIHISIKI